MSNTRDTRDGPDIQAPITIALYNEAAAREAWAEYSSLRLEADRTAKLADAAHKRFMAAFMAGDE